MIRALLAALALLSGCSRVAEKPELVIAAASDLRFAMDELIVRFKQVQAPAENIRVTYGSSGNFESQIRAGAPFDMYFSADVSYPRRLAADGFARGEVFQYAVGRIVVWTRSLDVGKGAALLTDPRVKHIAIANPAHAPYGKAAISALQTLGVYEAIEHKIVNSENVSQAWQYVAMGSADVGVIALSLALAPHVQQQGQYWEIPLSAYPKMDQGGIVLKTTDVPDLAESFRAFTLGPEGRRILKRYGFSL